MLGAHTVCSELMLHRAATCVDSRNIRRRVAILVAPRAFHDSSLLQDYYWAAVRDYFHFRPDLIRMAAKVVRRVMDIADGPYNSLHFRSTDWCGTTRCM